MKKILITGKNSYIGNSLETWLLKEADKYQVDKISLRDDTWKDYDFSQYDSLIHVASIVHKKETKRNKDSYYKVNRDLTYEVAKKAKIEKVKQFIFISSMSVYGKDSGVIDENTPLKPKNAYGKSKLEAELLLKKLESDNFKIATIRPPTVYGNGSKGNYSKLSQLAKLLPLFPDIENKRSMIYIDNLSELMKLIINDGSMGLFCPQNEEYVNTTEMVKLIANFNDKRILFTKVFNPLLTLSNLKIKNKIFGNLFFDKSISYYSSCYRLVKFEKSIEITEKGDE